MQKEKKYEFDNLQFMPGWWAQQLHDVEALYKPTQKFDWQVNQT